MFSEPGRVFGQSTRVGPREALLTAARLSPWVIFGPITGLMSEVAIGFFRRGRPALGLVCVALNVLILLALPLLTAVLAARL